MQGYTIKLLDFLEPSQTRFIIPLYQRNYDWKEEHCQQLFFDLQRIHRDKVESHFFGSIVSRQESLALKDILLIDGQQRITTVTLLLAAIRNAFIDGKLPCEDENKAEMIWDRFLYGKYLETPRKFKLQPIYRDQIALDRILEGKELIPESNLSRNYELFYNWSVNSGLTLDQILKAIEKLVVIDIHLDEKDDPQLIFESINSTGLDLSEADKIRNFFLMSLSKEEQEEYYSKYWNRIEEYTDYKPSMFMRDYLTIQLKKLSKLENLYHDFKRYIDNKGLNRCEILKDMLPYAKEYHKVVTADFDDPKISRKFKQMRTLDSNIDMPFYISFLRYAEEVNMSNEAIYQVLDVIEAYWARRIICNIPTNALNKVFSTLHNDIIRLMDKQLLANPESNPDYVEVLKYVLLRKQGSAIFPTDKQLEEEFRVRQIYHIPIAYRYFLFERMENLNGKELMDIVKSMKDNETTIEHIMPQVLTAQWRADLGPDAEEIHEKYLHTFANLTLTGYNPNYSNRSFAEKKAGYTDREGKHIPGFDESAYRLSASVKTESKWTEEELIKRGNTMYQRFLSLWPEIKTDFVEPELTDSVPFDTEDLSILTGRAIAAFVYKDVRHPVLSWKDMLVELCSIIYQENPVATMFLCKKDDCFKYSPDQDPDSSWSSIGGNCYAWSSNSTNTKMRMLHGLFDALSIDYDDLVFELRPESEGDVDEDGMSAADRAKYQFWLSVVEFNKKISGPYSNNSPTTDCWLGRQIDGANANAVIGRNSCRVELYINRGNQTENKRVYDYLVANKVEIEKQLGALNWQRLDDKIVCRISIERPLSYLKQEDHIAIVQFITDYTQRFLETFAPYFKKL